MAGIFGRYSDGHEYNLRNQLLHTYIPERSNLLLVSNKTIMYLQGDYVICNYSTISTPTIDERLFQYWTLYPDKVPEYIVWDKGSEGYIATNPEVNARLVENAELLVDDEGLLIYRLPANPYWYFSPKYLNDYWLFLFCAVVFALSDVVLKTTYKSISEYVLLFGIVNTIVG